LFSDTDVNSIATETSVRSTAFHVLMSPDEFRLWRYLYPGLCGTA